MGQRSLPARSAAFVLKISCEGAVRFPVSASPDLRLQGPLPVVGRQPHRRTSDGSFSAVSTLIFAYKIIIINSHLQHCYLPEVASTRGRGTGRAARTPGTPAGTPGRAATTTCTGRAVTICKQKQLRFSGRLFLINLRSFFQQCICNSILINISEIVSLTVRNSETSEQKSTTFCKICFL